MKSNRAKTVVPQSVAQAPAVQSKVCLNSARKFPYLNLNEKTQAIMKTYQKPENREKE